MMRPVLAIVIAACLVLAACGGGGGGGGGLPVLKPRPPGPAVDAAAGQRSALRLALETAEAATVDLGTEAEEGDLKDALIAINGLAKRIGHAQDLEESEVQEAREKLALYRQRYIVAGGEEEDLPDDRTGGGMPATPGDPDDPAGHLTTLRFTTYQPRVLEQIGAHHAYARGLTGAGVTIAIEDSIVDWTQTEEFGDRVKLSAADGAALLYWRPPGPALTDDLEECLLVGDCTVIDFNSAGDPEAANRAAQAYVESHGWPRFTGTAFFQDTNPDVAGTLFEVFELPTPFLDETPIKPHLGFHGTFVASAAAGSRFGVARGADIVPRAHNLTNSQFDERDASAFLLSYALTLPEAQRAEFDRDNAGLWNRYYRPFDIINRSYGPGNPPDWDTDRAAVRNDEAFMAAFLPLSRRALYQLDTDPGDRTVIVYAAGNDSHLRPDREAALPYYVPDVRGHRLAVVATDPQTRRIADYSDRCGPLPSDWDATMHGPHFCLAAPGTTRGVIPNPASPGRGDIMANAGTSYAAPVVSGSLALLMEHFRGMRGNTAIVKRMLDTADREGDYADELVYGAGHLDLEAALAPVGQMTAGRARAALAGSVLATPSAYGDVAQRAASLELAAFDAQEFPFWIPVSDLVTEASPLRSPIPRIDTPAVQGAPSRALDALGQVWAPLTPVQDDEEDGPEAQWAVGFGPGSASVARHAEVDGWGYGVNLDGGGHMGARISGAFGEDLRSGMVWAQRSVERTIAGGLALKATGTLAVSLPRYAGNAVFRPTPSAMSAASLRLGTGNTGITLEQPLRAESGRGRFSLETGEIEDGRRLRETVSVPLRPDARELRITVRQDMAVAGGTLALSLSAADDVGHVRGRRETTAGIAFRAEW